MASAPTYKLEGRVVKESGEWIQIYAPQIIDSMGKVLFTAHSFDVQSGAFAFGPVPAGTYTLRVSGMIEENPGLTQTVFSSQKIEVASDLIDVEVVLHPGIIPVIVRRESQQPLGPCWWNPLAEKFHPADCSDYKAARVQLVPVDSRRMSYTSGAGIMKKPTHFRMAGIEPGKYVVRVELPSYPSDYVYSVHSGSLDLLHEQLDVPEYGSVLPIEVVLRDDFALIKVETTEGKGGSVVVLLREDILLPAPQIPIHPNEEDSSFPVAPGFYAVFAFDSAKEDFSDPQFLSKYAGRAVHIVASAKETRTVDVDVIHIED